MSEMWALTSLDLTVLCVMLLTLGFGLGVMYWEWRTKERESDAGISGGFLDLPGDTLPGGVRSVVGAGGAGDPDPRPGGESRLDNRGASGTIVLSTNGAPSARD